MRSERARRQTAIGRRRRSFVRGPSFLLRSWLQAVRCAAMAVIVAAAPAGAADDGKASPRPGADYEALYARYLEVARVTVPDRSAPRWVDALFTDPRARSVNDLLTIRVVESASATGSADASVSKNSSGVGSILKFFGVEKKLSGLDPANLASTTSDTKFKGAGSTMRAGELTTNITVRVAEVLPNGDLALEGAREIDINGDRQMLVLTGVVRPLDVGPGNVVLSTAIGQLRVQYFGNGLIRDSLSPGWLVRILNKIF